MDTDRAVTTPPLQKSVVLFMAVAAALGTATIYPLQPGVADVARSLGVSITGVGMALACGPIGYMCGLVGLVPLVDRGSPRRVLAAQLGVLAVALVVASLAGNVWVLGVAIAAIGACSSVGASMSSVAGRLAPPQRRATTLGVVTAGISAGILLGRVLGGWLVDVLGWRSMLLVFAAVVASAAVLSLAIMRDTRASADRGYLATLRSMPGLFLRHPPLRRAAIRGALWFLAFCVVWAGLAVALSLPPYSLSADRIGLYAFAGLLGMVATRVSGRWTDRVGARRVILVGLALAAVSAAGLAVALPSPPLTLVCLALFDSGLFTAQVANQSTVLALDPTAPARFNSVYMVVYFVGGSIGTAIGTAAVDRVGWSAATAIALASIGAAAGLTVLGRREAVVPETDPLAQPEVGWSTGASPTSSRLTASSRSATASSRATSDGSLSRSCS